jgi:2-iminoacetate synthase
MENTNHMEYQKGMEVNDSNIMNQVLKLTSEIQLSTLLRQRR